MMEEERHLVLTNKLLDMLYDWVPLSASFRIALRDLLYKQLVEPKMVILNPPEYAIKAWFSANCYVAAYTYNANGDQHVVRIYLPNDVFTDLFSFFQGKPSRFRLVIIQGEELLYLKKEDFNGLKSFSETFDLVQYVMLAEQELEAWRVWIMTLKDEQKVQQFNLHYPMNLLPNHICASFLQMTPAKYCVEKALCNRSDRS